MPAFMSSLGGKVQRAFALIGGLCVAVGAVVLAILGQRHGRTDPTRRDSSGHRDTGRDVAGNKERGQTVERAQQGAAEGKRGADTAATAIETVAGDLQAGNERSGRLIQSSADAIRRLDDLIREADERAQAAKGN